MGILSRKMTAAAVGAAIIGGVVLPSAGAMAAPAQHNAPAAAASAQGIGVDAFSHVLDITKTILDAIEAANKLKENRPGYVKSLLEAAFNAQELHENYNVMVINTGNKFTFTLNNVVYDAVAHDSGYPDFHIYVFDSGRFENQGKGGYENWAFRGWFDRPGNAGVVNFHKKG
ncbi:hypothetical protein [Kutzneria sp. NPDC051319]|uniref:hypothetical protein n=1 Tax=Kutzneria sp. NPDC051319 TaxID=3155047 RepID=UPI00341A6BEF